jgi:hypothetical protein
MPALKYALAKGEPRRFVLSWSGFWLVIKNLTIHLDGDEIGSIPSVDELKSEREFNLDNGTLKVKFDGRGLDGWKFKVSKDEQLLVADPTPKLRNACIAIFIGAGLFILGGILGPVGQFFQIDFLNQWEFDYGSIIFGAILIMLGFFARKRSMVALGFAVGLYTLDSILVFISAISAIGADLLTITILRVCLLIYMFRGFSAIRDLKRGW